MAVTDEAITKIKDMIISGELSAGDRLPPEKELHQDESILELFEVRRMLEPAAAATAARLITPQQIAALRATMDNIDELTSVESLVEHDLVFHSLVTAAAGNTYLTSVLDSLSSSTVRARIWRVLTQERAVDRTLSEHAAIIDALERGDTELARSLVTVHISGVEHWLRHAL